MLRRLRLCILLLRILGRRRLLPGRCVCALRLLIQRLRHSRGKILSQITVQVARVLEPVGIFLRLISLLGEGFAPGRQGLAARQILRQFFPRGFGPDVGTIFNFPGGENPNVVVLSYDSEQRIICEVLRVEYPPLLKT